MLLRIIISFLMLIVPLLAVAQDDELDQIPFEEEELQEESNAYFVLSGGVNVNWATIDFDNVNMLHQMVSGNDTEFDSHLIMLGGQGFTGIPWIKNLRLGVFGYGGSNLTDEVSSTVDGNEILDQSEFQVSMFGFSLHYAYVPFKTFAVLGGLNFGWGDMTYEHRTTPSNVSWEVDNFGSGITRLENSYFFVTPEIEFDYALTDVVMIRTNIGYNLSFSQDANWQYNGNGTASGVPTEIKIDGIVGGVGIFIGLMNF